MKPSIYFLSRCRVVMVALLAAFSFAVSAEALESLASPARVAAAAPADAPAKKPAPAHAKKRVRKKRKGTPPPRKTPAKPAPASSSIR